MTLGNRLKEARLQQNLKVRDMAELLGVSERAYRNYENDERDIGTHALKVICDYLKISSEYLLGMSDKTEINHINTNSDIQTDFHELTSKQIQIVKLFEKLTEPQQDNIIGRAELLAEMNEEACRKEENA